MTARTSKPIPWPASALARSARRSGSAAYTVVEVLMSMAVLAVGVVGIIATQKVTLASNLHAKNLALATHIAQSWLGVLEAEAALWSKDPVVGLTRTVWLEQGANQTDWFRPSYDSDLAFGPAFDALGNAVPTQDQDPDAKFCVDLRLSPLTTNNTGGGLMRAEVRVIWLRMDTVLGGSVVPLAHACGASAVEVPGTNERRLFHFVFMSGAVRQVGK